MSDVAAKPLQCRCPNCDHRLGDIIEGVVQIKCQKRGRRGCEHTIRFTRAPGSNRVFAIDLDARQPK